MTGFVLTSDVHLPDATGELYQRWIAAVEKALSKTQAQEKRLLILGDLFELYIHGNAYFRRLYAPFFQKIKEWNERGIAVEWFEGNHDLYLPPADHVYQVMRTRFYVCHGDLLNPKDTAYLKLKKTLHRPFVRSLAQHVPGPVVRAIGHRISHKSKKDWVAAKPWTWADYEEELLKQQNHFEEMGVGIVIFGHCHWKKDVTVGDLRVINLGYFPEDGALLSIDHRGIAWIEGL